jgi:hypothetical protein
LSPLTYLILLNTEIVFEFFHINNIQRENISFSPYIIPNVTEHSLPQKWSLVTTYVQWLATS